MFSGAVSGAGAADSGSHGSPLALGRTLPDDVLLSAGWLWMTTTDLGTAASIGPSWLWRLDPSTLQVTSRPRLPAVRGGFAAGALAAAGDGLWVGDGGQ